MFDNSHGDKQDQNDRSRKNGTDLEARVSRGRGKSVQARTLAVVDILIDARAGKNAHNAQDGGS